MHGAWFVAALSAFVPADLVDESDFTDGADAAVAAAVVDEDVGAAPSAGDDTRPKLKFLLVPHVTRLRFADAGPRAQDRTGGGVALMLARDASFDLDVLPGRGGDARSYLFTLAAGCYSDFLGGGRRRLLNPYLGFRLGGAKMNGFGAFAYGADAGVELVRFPLFLVEASASAIGLWYHRSSFPTSDLLLVGRVGVAVPW
jgi:hypothetical protein